MKLYIWKNGRTNSDFTEIENMSADHSACLVVLADSIEDAKEYGKAHRIETDPFEMEITEKGDVVYADGDC